MLLRGVLALWTQIRHFCENDLHFLKKFQPWEQGHSPKSNYLTEVPGPSAVHINCRSFFNSRLFTFKKIYLGKFLKNVAEYIAHLVIRQHSSRLRNELLPGFLSGFQSFCCLLLIYNRPISEINARKGLGLNQTCHEIAQNRVFFHEILALAYFDSISFFSNSLSTTYFWLRIFLKDTCVPK